MIKANSHGPYFIYLLTYECYIQATHSVKTHVNILNSHHIMSSCDESKLLHTKGLLCLFHHGFEVRILSLWTTLLMKNLHVLYKNEYNLTVLIPVHLIIVGSILPLNIL